VRPVRPGTPVDTRLGAALPKAVRRHLATRKPQGELHPAERRAGGSSTVGGTTGIGGCNLGMAFGVPVQVVPSTATSNENGITVLPNGSKAYVGVRASSTGNFDLKSVTRTAIDLAFGSPMDDTDVSALNTADSETDPQSSEDGVTLLLARSTSITTQIYMSNRANTTVSFSTATVLGNNVNSAQGTFAPRLNSLKTQLYWTANWTINQGDISGINVTNVTTPAIFNLSAAKQRRFVLTDDQKTAYFGSDATVSSASYFRVYVSTRATTTAAWSTPTIVAEVDDNSKAYALADISGDGCIIYLQSNSNSHLYQARKPN